MPEVSIYSAESGTLNHLTTLKLIDIINSKANSEVVECFAFSEMQCTEFIEVYRNYRKKSITASVY